MVASGERQLRMLVIHARHQAGFFHRHRLPDPCPEDVRAWRLRSSALTAMKSCNLEAAHFGK